MYRTARAIVACASLAAFAVGAVGASAVLAAPAPLSLTSFGAPQIVSSSGLAFASVSAPRGFDDAGLGVLPSGFGLQASSGLTSDSFAMSLALSPMLALDSGSQLDIASRFANFDRTTSPMMDGGASFLGLANGGHYAGATYSLMPDLTVRLGASLRRDRLDSVSFDGLRDATGLPLAFDRSQTHSILAGVSWDLTDWAGLGLNAISSSRDGVPLGYGRSNLASAANTNALGVTARFNLGGDWTTHIDYARGLTQLDQRSNATSQQAQSYSITFAKHGVFGDDALGFSLSRPAPGMLDSFTSLAAPQDLPPMLVSGSQNPASAAPETDFQLGYVTSIANGVVQLQTNAAYQVNAQGQAGATAVSVLSRAKIKF